MGETTPKSVKLFVVLTQADLHSKFPEWTGPLALFSKLSSLHTHLSAWVTLGHIASRSCCQPFPSGGARGHSPHCVGLWLGSLPGWEWEGSLQAALNFSNRLSVWEGLGTTLSLVYKLIPLPVHSTGMLPTWYWFCTRGPHLCLPSSWLERSGSHSFQEVSPAFWADGTERHSPHEVGLWFSFLPGIGQTEL